MMILFSNSHILDVSRDEARPSLAWLAVSAVGGALAALVVAGVVLGRLGLPVSGVALFGAALAGALPQVVALARGRWVARWPELLAAPIALLAVGAVGLGLAWPSLLPLGLSVDAVHHAQLVAWVAEHRALPQPGGDLQGLLGEMVSYPVGMALVVVAVAQAAGRPPIDVLYPTAAVLGALIAALVVLLSSAAASERRLEMRNSASNLQSVISRTLALLVGPLLLLAHRTYLLEAYIDHSYYTMVLGVLLVLLAAGYLIAEPRLGWGACARLGLVLAALMGTYPLWAPLPAALAAGVILRQGVARRKASDRRRTTDDGRPTVDQRLMSKHERPTSSGQRLLVIDDHERKQDNVLRSASCVLRSTLCARLTLAFGPALAVALLDVLPRMRVGQSVLAHEGLVTMPTAARLTPILLALPLGILLARGGRGRRLLVLAAMAALMMIALAVAARFGLAARYHSYKVLFVLTPLAAAIAGAGAMRASGLLETLPSLARASRRASAESGAGIVLFSSYLPLLAELHPRTLWAAGLALALALTGSFRVVPPPAIQILTPDMVAATRWLAEHSPKDANRALVVGAPAGPLSYWVQIGLLGQRRDRARAAFDALTDAPPSPESWLVDERLAPVAIAPSLDAPPPGMTVLARFGRAAVIRRAAPLDMAALNPLAIRYRTFWEDERVKTAIELRRPHAGVLPLIELRLYHAGAPLVAFDLAPDQRRTRPQYLGADLLPGTLGGEGYVNRDAYPIFAPPSVAPTGALTLTLRLSLGGNTLEERQLATFQRDRAGQVYDLNMGSGELIYLRRDGEPAGDSPRPAVRLGVDFDGALELVAAGVPTTTNASEPLPVDLSWRAARALDRSLFPEVLVRDARGQIVASSLQAPQDGFYPTWRWRPGEIVRERRAVALPAGLPPGNYRVAVRVRDFAAPRALARRAAAGDLVEIGVVRIVS